MDPDNKEWLSYSTELCGGTPISNTREDKAFALLSEEGIAKGIRRVTAVTTDCAINANELADSFDAEISDASKAEGSVLEKKIASLKNRTYAATIPAARKAELRAKISQLQAQLIEEKKRVKEENIQKAINVATETAEAAASEGKVFCVIRLDMSADVAAVQQKAVLKVKDQKILLLRQMIVTGDETKEYVYMCIQQRNDRKTLTAMQGLNKESSYNKIHNDFKKEFFCNVLLFSFKMIKGRTLLHSLFRAQLAKAYQTVGVLFEVLCAVNKTEKVKEVSSEAQDFEDPDVHHRHVSHLFGLFLGHTTTLEDTPDLCKAVDNSLYKRGDFGPGWLTTWKMALWAHLHNSEHAYKLVKLLINLVDPDHEANYEGGLYGNLFTAHPPFQIDANFGFTAGIAECYFRAQ